MRHRASSDDQRNHNSGKPAAATAHRRLTTHAWRMSRHAIIRQQQRAIDDRIIELLQLWGRRQHDGHGGHRVWFDKRARRKLTQELDHDEYVRLERKLNTYAVVSANGTVITVARITRRTRR